MLNIYKIIATVLLVGLNILLIVKKKEKLLLIILLFELVVNTVWIGLDSRMGLDEKYWTAKELLDDFSSNCTDLRCEIKGGFSSNDSILGNYHGVSIFLSTANGKPISFLAKASNYTDSRNYYYYHPDLILDMLLGIERIEDTDIVNGYQVLNEQKLYDKTYYLLHNPYALSLGYTVSPKLKDFSSKEEGFFYLEELLNAMIDQNNSYVLSLPLEQMDDHHYQLTVDSTYPYLYLYTDSVPTVNGKEIDNYLFTADDYGVIYLPQEEVISLYFEEQPSHVEIYTISLEQLEQFEKNVTQWNVTENTGNRLTGTIEVEEDTTLLLTIPYEQGWEVYVDGKKTKMFSLLDAFIGIDVLEGTHQITLKYHIPGLALGILVSMISLGILILYEKWGKRRLLFKQ